MGETGTRTTDAARVAARDSVVTEVMADIRSIDADEPGRLGVERIRDRLVQMTKEHPELFSFEDFPAPGPSEKQNGCLYRLAEDDDHRYALYVNSSRGGTSTPAHNHTTWAVVVGFSGQELNRFYERTDDQRVRATREYMVENGTGVAMVGEDLHSIHIDGPALNFHCYGLALEQLTERQYYSEREDVWKVFPPNSDIREARGDR